jgi:ribonuclease HII
MIIGIDEVGRGPLAGPVTLCACAISAKELPRFFKGEFKGIKDSKQLTPVAREVFFKKAKMALQKGVITYAVSHVGAPIIDRIGISKAVARALGRCLIKLEIEAGKCQVLLDGSLKAPAEFTNQKTIIGGDASVPIISLASVIAKVVRDRKMCRLAKRYPQYGFEIHKGYGTRAHTRAIRSNGLCDLHRRSFCKNFINVA